MCSPALRFKHRPYGHAERRYIAQLAKHICFVIGAPTSNAKAVRPFDEFDRTMCGEVSRRYPLLWEHPGERLLEENQLVGLTWSRHFKLLSGDLRRSSDQLSVVRFAAIPRQLATADACATNSAGIGRSSCQVMAIGRSPVWLTCDAGPRKR